MPKPLYLFLFLISIYSIFKCLFLSRPQHSLTLRYPLRFGKMRAAIIIGLWISVSSRNIFILRFNGGGIFIDQFFLLVVYNTISIFIWHSHILINIWHVHVYDCDDFVVEIDEICIIV